MKTSRKRVIGWLVICHWLGDHRKAGRTDVVRDPVLGAPVLFSTREKARNEARVIRARNKGKVVTRVASV